MTGHGFRSLYSLSGHCRNRLRKLDLLFPTWTKINQTSSWPYPLKKRMCFQTRRHGNLRTRLVVFWPDLAKSPSVFTRVTFECFFWVVIMTPCAGICVSHVFVQLGFMFSCGWEMCLSPSAAAFWKQIYILDDIPFCLPEISWVIGRFAVLFPNMLDLHSRRSSVSEAAEGATVMWQCLKS